MDRRKVKKILARHGNVTWQTVADAPSEGREAIKKQLEERNKDPELRAAFHQAMDAAKKEKRPVYVSFIAQNGVTRIFGKWTGGYGQPLGSPVIDVFAATEDGKYSATDQMNLGQFLLERNGKFESSIPEAAKTVVNVDNRKNGIDPELEDPRRTEERQKMIAQLTALNERAIAFRPAI